MSTAQYDLSVDSRPGRPGPELPTGVRQVGQVMPLVLAQYGLSPEEGPQADRAASVNGDLFDVTIGALESVLAG